MIFKKNKHGDAGYTLIELALVLVVVGLVATPLLSGYALYKKREARETTIVNVDKVKSAIASYLTMNGYYPCPAPLTAVRGDTLYGHETDCTDTSVDKNDPIDLNDPDTGYLVELSQNAAAGNPRVRRGAVPFRVLNLPEETAYDGYGNRIVYVVTEPLAVSATFDHNNGGIEILAEKSPDVSAINPPMTGHLIVYSHGENGLGAFNKSGKRFDPCPVPAFDENENCDETNKPTYLAASLLNASGTKDHFDDRVVYFTRGEIPLWSYLDADTNTRHIKTKLSGNVGVKDNNPDITGYSGSSSYVAGNIRARDSFYVSELCPMGSTECFQTKKIAGLRTNGTDNGMVCPDDDIDGTTGPFMVEIKNGRPVCVDAPDLEFQCPEDHFIRGFDDEGRPVCINTIPKPCPSTKVILCAGTPVETTYNTPYRVHGADFWTSVVGDSYKRRYACLFGSLHQIEESGVCVCNPYTIPEIVLCEPGFSGKMTVESTLHCPGGTVTTEIKDDSGCACEDTIQTREVSCEGNLTGFIQQQRQHNCATEEWGPWVNTISTCTCVPASGTKTYSCGGGLEGTIVKTWEFKCPEAETNITSTVENCTCTDKTESKRIGCEEGKMGYKDVKRTLACPSGIWSAWVTVNDQCEDMPPVACKWQVYGSSSTQSGTAMGYAVNTTCGCGEKKPCYETHGYGNYTNYSECFCE